MKHPQNHDTIVLIIVSILIAFFVWYTIKGGTIVVGCPAPPH